MTDKASVIMCGIIAGAIVIVVVALLMFAYHNNKMAFEHNYCIGAGNQWIKCEEPVK